MKGTPAVKPIVEVKLRTIAHLYDPDDPTPENDRELSDRAEDAINHSILDLSKPLHAGTTHRMELRLPAADLTPQRENDIPAAVRAHFLRRAGETRRAMRLTQRIGLREFRLTIAVCFFTFLGIAGTTFFPHDPVASVLQNIFVIMTWVVIWQPFQSLVFDRWTNDEQAKVFDEISRMEIRVLPSE